MEYRPRLLDAPLDHLIRTFPAVSVAGPRACGKTTTASRLVASVARLDIPAVAAAFGADVDAALVNQRRPVLLDEWQAVPELIGAVKRAVDTTHDPGQFVLTGSVNAEVDTHAWPGTGRIVRVSMSTMTRAEIDGALPDLPSLRALLAGRVTIPDAPDLAGYVDLAMAGGFPEAADLADTGDRRLWFASYVEQLVTRDVARFATTRDAGRLRRYLQVWALNSAGIVDDVTLYAAAGIDRRTHLAYERLLDHLFVVDLVPAWTSNRLKRSVLAPKRFVSDCGVMAAAARIGRADVLDSGDLLGRTIETFVHHEIAARIGADPSCTLHHLRTAGGRHEVDLVAEFDGGRIVGIEVKATSAPSRHDVRHLAWLRDQMGEQFEGGVVFHTGPRAFEVDDRVLALPISALWGRSV